MTQEEEREYCLEHCPFPNGDCSSRCTVFRRGDTMKATPVEQYKPRPSNMKLRPSNMKLRKARGRELLLRGEGKSAIARELDVSYSTVQRWEAELVREGFFKKPQTS